MQILEATRNVQTAGIGQVHKATIKASAKVFSFFSDQTYTDKPRTIIREYTANGVDEHNQSGRSEERMIITLPNEDNPVLSFRDFGRGMSHDFITGPFMAYADGSTKTADNVAIGGLGIGSKSGFSYTDQFLIRSIHEGMSRTYSMFKDEEGVPGIALLDEQASSEPNGCEIMIPIEPEDFNKFKEAAVEVLGYFNPQPILNGAKIKQPDYIARGDNWAVRKEAGELAVIMGGVRYPVSSRSLPWDVRNDALTGYGVDLTMPIGSCSVALSREALSMDERTTAAIIGALASCKQAIIDSFATVFDGYTSRWEASKALGEMQRGHSNRYALLSQHAKYMGEPLTTHYRVPDVEISQHDNRGRRTTISRFDFVANAGVQPSRVAHLIIDDLPETPQKRLLARVKHEYGSKLRYDRDVLVVRKEGADVQTIVDALGNPETYVLASSLPVPPPAPRVTGTRSSQPVFGCSRNGYYGQSDLRKLDSVEGRTILVEMDRFATPRDFHQQWNMNLVEKDKVVFANKLGAKQLKGKLTPWSEAFAAAREELLGQVDTNAVAHIKWVKENADELDNFFTQLNRIRQNLGDLTPAQQKRPFGKIVDLYDRFYSVPRPEGYALVKAKRPPRLNAEALADAFKSQQPKAHHILSSISYHSNVMETEILKDYI